MFFLSKHHLKKIISVFLGMNQNTEHVAINEVLLSVELKVLQNSPWQITLIVFRCLLITGLVAPPMCVWMHFLKPQ